MKKKHIYIYNFRYDIKEKYDEIDIVLKFLQQLYVTYFNENGIPTVTNCKHAILNFIKSKSISRNQLYFVRCDIQDAFGSIIQGIIYCLSHLIYLSSCYSILLLYFRKIIWYYLHMLQTIRKLCCGTNLYPIET